MSLEVTRKGFDVSVDLLLFWAGICVGRMQRGTFEMNVGERHVSHPSKETVWQKKRFIEHRLAYHYDFRWYVHDVSINDG